MLEQILLGEPALLVHKLAVDYNLPVHQDLALKFGCTELVHHQPLMLDASALHSHLYSQVCGFCDNSLSDTYKVTTNNILAYTCKLTLKNVLYAIM